MYKLYYDFDLVTEYLECYLIDSSSQLFDSLELLFIYITKHELSGIKLYRQCSDDCADIAYSVNTVNLKSVDYNDFLHIYNTIKPHLWPLGIHKEVQLDLDLILINWGVD